MRTKKLFTLLAAGAIVLSVATTTSAKGGDNGRLSIGAELALPMGTFGDQSGMGFGVSARYEMPMGDNLALMGTVGYLTFGKKSLDVLGYKYEYTNSFIPIQVGAKYYFTEQQNGLYGSFQLGITMFSSKFSYTVPAQAAVVIGGVTYSPAVAEHTVSSTGNSSELSFAPGLGYHLDNIDLGLSYQIVSATGGSLSYLGVRIAYVLGSK